MPDHNAKYAGCPPAAADAQQNPTVTASLELIAAVEALAETRLVERDETGYGSAASEIKARVCCKECFRAGLHGGPVPHAASCCVGQALCAAKLLRQALNADALLRAIDAASVAEQSPARAEMQAHAEGGDDAWHQTRRYAAEVARNRTGGTLASGRTEITESNFFTAEPVRKIVYDVCGVDVMGNATSGDLREATHEEAAALRVEVLGEAAI